MDYWQAQIDFYRRGANEMREYAENTVDPDLKQSFLKLARDYDSLAQKASRAYEEEMVRRNKQINSDAG